jgi:hypothetical protein
MPTNFGDFLAPCVLKDDYILKIFFFLILDIFCQIHFTIRLNFTVASERFGHYTSLFQLCTLMIGWCLAILTLGLIHTQCFSQRY